jgi:hypothetical protein
VGRYGKLKGRSIHQLSGIIQLFAATVEAQDARRQKLIANVLEELTRLSG